MYSGALAYGANQRVMVTLDKLPLQQGNGYKSMGPTLKREGRKIINFKKCEFLTWGRLVSFFFGRYFFVFFVRGYKLGG